MSRAQVVPDDPPNIGCKTLDASGSELSTLNPRPQMPKLESLEAGSGFTASVAVAIDIEIIATLRLRLRPILHYCFSTATAAELLLSLVLLGPHGLIR